MAVNALFRLRAAQGVVGLADKHGGQGLDAACGNAIAAGDPSYRTIKGILAVGAETDPIRPGAGDGGAAAYLHGPSQLFATVITLPTTNTDSVDVSATSGDDAEVSTTSGEHPRRDNGEGVA